MKQYKDFGFHISEDSEEMRHDIGRYLFPNWYQQIYDTVLWQWRVIHEKMKQRWLRWKYRNRQWRVIEDDRNN